ncbi:MAG: DUF5916 domain-containing protein [Gemmatimonadota bacterium]
MAPPALAQEARQLEGLRPGPGGEPPVRIPRISGAIELDGRPDEPAWEQAATFEGVMHLPDFGAEPTERTEFLLGHDGEYLYMACRAYDSNPGAVRVTTLERDASTYNTDGCGIRLDSYNDEENALLFNVTPAGQRTDWTFANDAQGPPNQDWDAFWDAEGTMREWGWSGEMRIPFSSVGFQEEEDGTVVMGFMLARSITRKNETTVHPAVPPNWGPSSIAKPSQMRKMILTGLQSERPVYVTPYGLTGGGHSHALNDPGTAWQRSSDEVLEVGGDVRYNLTRNLTMDLTANTDFAQVEVDDQQVNLTRFSLFFPEKRRFFQERAAIFEFPLESQERLFHSRRIGLVNGEQVRIWGGGRIVGRVQDWDIGFINMQTAEHDPLTGPTVPGENLGVTRLRRRIINAFSYVGGIVTHRVGTDGSYNVLYGSDAVFRLFGQDYLTLNWAQSFDDADEARTDVGVLDRALLRAEWQRRGTDGLTYRAGVTRAGDVFEPGMGFLRRSDYLNGSGQVGYGWRPGAGSALNSYGVSVNGGFYQRNADDTYQSGDFGGQANLQSRGGHSFNAGVTRSYEDLTRTFSLSPDASVPVGSYWFTEGQVRYNAPMGALIRPSVSVSGGQYFDGDRISFNVSPTWSVNRHLQLGGTYELNRIRFDLRDQEFTSHIGRLRSNVTFTTATSTAAFIQYNSAEDLVVANLRFHYNPREGNDLYIVWNETLNADRVAFSPERPLSQERTLLIKYAHTLTLGF